MAMTDVHLAKAANISSYSIFIIEAKWVTDKLKDKAVCECVFHGCTVCHFYCHAGYSVAASKPKFPHIYKLLAQSGDSIISTCYRNITTECFET